MNMSAADFRKKTYNYETQLRQRNKTDLSDESHTFINSVQEALTDLSKALTANAVKFSDILQLHIKTAELFAASDTTENTNILWRGEAGKCAAQFITKMLESADVLGSISGKDYIPAHTRESIF